MHMIKYWAVSALVVLMSGTLLFSATNDVGERAVIQINTARPGPTINPRLYGIFLEEINHGVDGGLYGELIRNRGFEDARPPEGYVYENGRWQNRQGFDSGFTRYGYTTNGVPFWSAVQTGDARGYLQLETTGGITEASAYCLQMKVEAVTNGQFGVANEGFFGIGVRAGAAYRLSLYAHGNGTFAGPLHVRLEDASGKACSETVTLTNIPASWTRFEQTLAGTVTESKARLVIAAGSPGQVWLDFVSLFPTNTWKNHPNGLRPDIADLIAGLHPGFVRFPGGCVVEAGTPETAYNWKLTVGLVEQRQERWGPWNYRRTQGMGFFEYLQFCEDLGAEPLYVGFAGQTCIFRGPQLVPMAQMDWVKDNFVDAVSYANAPADSKWGALRAQAGHPEPFNLKLVEIGNENQGPEFEPRYNLVHDALKAQYPALTCLADLSWTSRESMQDAKFDIEDQHYYNSTRWFSTGFKFYDDRDRALPPLYLGEVAVTTPEAGDLRGNLRAALSEGIFLMGCERNADVVKMVSYAPLLANVEGRTELTGAPPPWHAMIYFDGIRAFGTASYYLWQLFSANRPDQTVQTEVSFPDAKSPMIMGQIGLGTWTDTAEFKDLYVEQNGQVLYSSDFSTTAKDWQTEGGRWSVQDGAYRQTRMGQGFSYFGDTSWTNYTLTLKARNDGGSEGFLIIFGRHEGERFWWNLGGWGNTQHAIEFNQTPVGTGVPGQIERKRWYDIKIAVEGSRIRCYLDGQLIHDVTVPIAQKFYSIAGREQASGDLILKAINLGNAPVAGMVNLANLKQVMPQATLTVLTSSELSDNNSLEQPTKVSPTTSPIDIPGKEFPHTFPAHSLTILRLKTHQPPRTWE